MDAATNGVFFDIGRYCGGSRTSNNECARGRLQLDSGYYLEAETSWASQDAVERPNERHGVAAPQEDPSTMTVKIRHKDEVHEWEVWPHDTVQQLQIFVQN